MHTICAHVVIFRFSVRVLLLLLLLLFLLLRLALLAAALLLVLALLLLHVGVAGVERRTGREHHSLAAVRVPV